MALRINSEAPNFTAGTTHGPMVMIVPAASNEEAATLYPDGWETRKPYLRLVAQPEKA